MTVRAIKALSLHQPWANRIRSGEKTIETRMWRTSYRGEILICSTKTPPIKPAGYALALCRLVDVRPMTPADVEAACCPWEKGRYAWVLEDVRAIHPFPMKGEQRLFDIILDDEVDLVFEEETMAKKDKPGVPARGRDEGRRLTAPEHLAAIHQARAEMAERAEVLEKADTARKEAKAQYDEAFDRMVKIIDEELPLFDGDGAGGDDEGNGGDG